MSGDRKRTRTLNIETRPLGNLIGEQAKLSYDRADLAKTPLAKLVGLSGIVIGQKNLLEGFSDQIKSSLKELDIDYRFKSDRYERYISIVGNGLTGRAAEFRDAAKQDLKETRGRITDLLVEKFNSVFEFLIDSLEDERLEKMGLGISQKKVATILYDHLDYFETTYRLGKGATVLVMSFAKQKATEKGERIVKNVERNELDIRMLQQGIAGAAGDLTRPAPGAGLTGGLPSRISPYKETLPPPVFRPDSESPTLGASSATAATETNKDPIYRYITGKTMPFSPGVVVPGSYEDSIQKGVQEAMEEFDLRPSKVPAIVSPGISDDGIETPDTTTAVISSTAPASGSFNSSEVPGMVDGRSISYSAEAVFPPRPNSEIKDEAKVVITPETQTEAVDKAQLERAPTQLEVIAGNEARIDQPAEEDRKTLINERKNIILPPPPESWWSRTKEKVSGWYGNAKASVSKFYDEAKSSVAGWYKSAKDLVLPKLRKVAKPLAVVAGLVAFSAIGVNQYNSTVEKKDESAESAKLATTTPSASSIASTAPSAVEIAPNANSSSVDLTQTPDVKTPLAAPAAEFTPKFANVLLHSKSPLVQQIIKDGKLTIGTQSITDAMIGSMKGLTNDAQKLQVAELEKQINLGLGVYFNEHFGTPAKVAESLKDPNLRNLYRTVKYAQKKGWFSSYHTKEKFPQAYLLATQLLEDSHELGHDASDNPNLQVRASVQGNMFQAKTPGSTINLKKADGHYHVVTEYMIGIFEGKNVNDMMKTEFAAASAKEAGSAVNAPAGVNNAPVIGQPVNAPKVDDKNNGQQGTILPNIIGQRGVLDSAAGTLDSTDSVESGWDKLLKRADQMSIDKAAFENKGMVEFDLPLSMTTRQENEAVLPTLIEKVIALNPQADAATIRKLIKRYGFIGVRSWARTKPGHFKIELHPNFLKILKPELKKSANKVS